MRWSQMFIPTLRESPAKEASRPLALMARAGYARVEARAITAYLPLGQRCIRKIEGLVRRRLVERGGQEFSLRGGHGSKARPPEDASAGVSRGEAGSTPRMSGAPPPIETDRILSEIASNHLRSYKELPQTWFYSGFGPFRASEAYFVRSFFLSVGEASDMSADDPAWAALSSVIRECGITFAVARGAPKPRREAAAQEHVVLSPDGELKVAVCGCGYSGNLECAVSRVEHTACDEPSPDQPRLVETPDKRTIADVSELLGVPPASIIKSLLYIIAGKPVLALVRGDDQLNESLLCRAAGSSEARPATADEVQAIFGAEPGSIGPVGQTHVRVLADHALRHRRNLVCGANTDSYHLTGVEPEKHFRAEYFDLREVGPGDPCPNCGEPLSVEQARGLMRSSALQQITPEMVPLRVLGADNKLHPLSVNVHTLYLDTLLLSLIEQLSDEDGVVLPRGIAPFDVVVTPISYRDKEQRDVCDRIYNALIREGADVLLDDRDCSPGVKFKDADLIGVPLRITVGPKKLRDGKVELRSRRTRESFDCSVEEVVQPAMKRFIP